MKEKKFFVKMFIVFACFFMLFILSNSQVFASSSKTGDEVTFANFPDEFIYNDYLILYDSRGSLYRIFNYDSTKVCLGIETKEESGVVAVNVYGFLRDTGKRISGDNCLLAGSGGLNSVSSFFRVSYVDSSMFGVKSLEGNYFSSSDVFSVSKGADGTYSLDKTNKVFSVAKETILVPIAQSMDFLAVTKEILGILPMILVVLIGLLGLMKAIRQMLKMLRQA